MLITGTSDSGKSVLARQMFLSARPPRTVIDPGCSGVCDVAGAAVARYPDKVDLSASTSRYVPADPGDLDAYNELYRRIWEAGGPRYVWCDEAGLVFPSNGTKSACRLVIIQGRGAEIGHLSLHTRPVEVWPQLRANTQHVICFDLPSDEDRKTIARDTGTNQAALEAMFKEADSMVRTVPGSDGPHEIHGFLWYVRGEKTWTICPPLEAVK